MLASQARSCTGGVRPERLLIWRWSTLTGLSSHFLADEANVGAQFAAKYLIDPSVTPGALRLLTVAPASTDDGTAHRGGSPADGAVSPSVRYCAATVPSVDA